MKQLKDLPVGAIVQDPRWKMYDEVIKFRKVADGHYTSDDTVLITDKIIKYMCVDAKEPNNSNSGRSKYGNNRYIHSNIRQWLNSTETNWYSDQHSADQAPNKANVWNGYNPYDSIPGFLSTCPDDFRKAILNTNLEVVKTKVDGGGKESFTDKVFLPSKTEIGLGQENSLDDGKPIPYFNSDSRRKAIPTESAKKNNDDSSDYAYYWLRTPDAVNSYGVRSVNSDGSLCDSNASYGGNGVRPALRLDGSTLVESQGDEYVLKFNTPPVISGKDEDLGDITDEFSYKYTVTDEDLDTMTVVEKINDVVINTHENISSGTDLEFKISGENFDKLELNKEHRLIIEVTDTVGNKAVRIIKFTKVAKPSDVDVPNNLGEVYELDFEYTVKGNLKTDIKFTLNDKVIYEKADVEKNTPLNFKYDISGLLNKTYILIIETTTKEGTEVKKVRFTKKTKTDSRAWYQDNTGRYRDYAVKYLTDGVDKLSFDDLNNVIKSIGSLDMLSTKNKDDLVSAINEVQDTKVKRTVADIQNLSLSGDDELVKITWIDPDDTTLIDSNGQHILYSKWEKTVVVRKQGNKPSINIHDGAKVLESYTRNEYKDNPFLDINVVNDIEYCYTVFTVSDSNGISRGVSEVVTPTDSDDPTGSPGNGKLLKGTMKEGYFGAVPSRDLISGDELARKVGVTQGTAQHSNTPWHKFAYKDKILFVAQKTIRNSISWAHLNDKDVVYGNKTIEIGGVKYKVRLLKGALTDPSDYDASDRGAKGSEWNRLIAPLNHQRKNNSWDYPAYMESDLQDWETYLDDKEMTVRDVNGRRSWCQEVGGDGSARRVYRGVSGVSYSSTNSSSTTGPFDGWRPVLEVAQ